jgi:hypothetical protein
MLTLRQPSVSASRFPSLGLRSLHRCTLRLRARWLAWRGQALLHAVPGTGDTLGTGTGSARTQMLGLLELNLMLERARAQRNGAHPG